MNMFGGFDPFEGIRKQQEMLEQLTNPLRGQLAAFNLIDRIYDERARILAQYELSLGLSKHINPFAGLNKIDIAQYSAAEKMRQYLEGGESASIASQIFKVTESSNLIAAFERMQLVDWKQFQPETFGISKKVLQAAAALQATDFSSEIEKSLNSIGQNHALKTFLNAERATSFAGTLASFTTGKSAADFMMESIRASDWLHDYSQYDLGTDGDSPEDVPIPDEDALKNAPDLIQAIAQWARENKVGWKSVLAVFAFIWAMTIKPTTDIYVQEYYSKPILEHFFGKPPGDNANANIKRILKEAMAENRETITREAFRDLAVVSKEVLSVHINPRQKSPKVDSINKGHVVKLLRENRDWVFVEYTGNNGVTQGWVLRRYVLKAHRFAS